MRKGILLDTVLYNECLAKYLLICDAEGYAGVKEVELVDAFRSFTQKDKFLLIVNLLKKVSLNILKKYKDLYASIGKAIVAPSTIEQLKKCLDENNVLTTYEDWGKLCRIDAAFKGDPQRVEFWTKYVLVCDLYDNNPNIVYFAFGEVVVTEFKHTAAGPAYFFDKQAFYADNGHIRKLMRIYSKSDFQKYLHDLWEAYKAGRYKGMVREGRYPHAPKYDWPGNFTYELGKLGIKPKVIK